MHSINRKGADTIKTEEVKTPKKNSASSRNSSSSPVKRQRLDSFLVDEPIPMDLNDLDISKKRHTLVSSFCILRQLFLSHPFQDQNDYLRQFLKHEKSYLKCLMGDEIPPSNSICVTCGDSAADFRCSDCFGPHWWCRGCLLKSHIWQPFHRPQRWKDGSFEKVSLYDLGAVLNLGQSCLGGCCSEDGNPFGDRTMTVIHLNGVFTISIRFCRCQGAAPDHEQLFSNSLFASTFDRPETAFTFQLLDYFAIDNMECKTSAQSFFQKLRRMTNNAFPDEVPVS